MTYGALAKGVVLDSTVSGIVAGNFLVPCTQLDTAGRSVADVLVELQGRIAGASIAC